MAETFKGKFKWFIENLEKKDIATYSKEEVIAMLRTLYKEFEGFYKKDAVIKFIVPEGFKGVGDFKIYQNIYCDVVAQTIIAYRNDDGTIQEIVTKEETVPKENINKMIEIINSLPLNEPYRCYAIARKLGYEWSDLWAERNKTTSKAYWLEYYYAIKFLQWVGMINYTTRGTITRIK